jgi:hypothetical protein
VPLCHKKTFVLFVVLGLMLNWFHNITYPKEMWDFKYSVKVNSLLYALSFAKECILFSDTRQKNTKSVTSREAGKPSVELPQRHGLFYSPHQVRVDKPIILYCYLILIF